MRQSIAVHREFEGFIGRRMGTRQPVETLTLKFSHALAQLYEAHQYAEQTSGKIWDFALEIQQLQDIGLSYNDLRLLVRLQLVEHASELRSIPNGGRRFKASGALQFTNTTCFVLTSTGINVAVDFGLHVTDVVEVVAPSLWFPNLTNSECTPIWDAESQELSYEGQIVKAFRWCAINQQRILAAFQEEGWPRRVSDPLPPDPTLVTKRRLNDAIKSLNRKQVNNLIRFRGDGTGQAVIWEKYKRPCLRGTAG